jgi:hypothetical protein
LPKKSVKLWPEPQGQILLQKISHKTSSQVFIAVNALCCDSVQSCDWISTSHRNMLPSYLKGWSNSGSIHTIISIILLHNKDEVCS